MPFDSNLAKIVGKKSKIGPPKKEGPFVKEKMEMLYGKILDDLLVNLEKQNNLFGDSTYVKYLKSFVNENK
ncbi:MAG: hypothetical protein ACJ0OB_04480 [Flavobacteriaceae bacterium]|mgnify:CR=1 FL=1|tara:strand:- start:614 stop:826 length:213 start_codon:yes stop_codon:yes gene_type:complete